MIKQARRGNEREISHAHRLEIFPMNHLIDPVGDLRIGGDGLERNPR
jgi:hypothetical protein